MSREYTRLTLVRQFLATNFTVVVVLLLLLASVGGGLTYLTHVDPETEYEDRTVATASTTSEYRYGATVREENPVFPVGTELTDRTHFFTTVTPTFEGTYTFTHATGDGDLEATTELLFVLESTADGETLWTDEDRLAATADAGGRTTTSFSVNMTSVNARIAAIERDLGTPPHRIDITVRARTTLSGELAGERVSETLVHDLAVIPQDETYRIVGRPGPDPTIRITERRPVESASGTLSDIGSILLVVLPLVTLAGLVGVKRRDRLEPRELNGRSIAFERHRRAYDEWISRGALTGRRRRPSVEIETLEDLVDVAIDSDNRVIEDVESDTYYVLTSEALYAFTPPDPDGDER